MEMVRIGILGVAGVMIALQFKTVKPEISLYIGFAVCIVIFTFSVNGMMQILSKMEELQKYISGSDSYFALLFQAVLRFHLQGCRIRGGGGSDRDIR